MTEKVDDRKILLEKGRRGVLRLVFGRTTLILLMFLVQIMLLLGIVEAFSKHVPFFFGGYVAFGLCITLIIINKAGNPEMKLSWAVVTLLLPVLGGVLYLYVEMHPGHRMLEWRLNQIFTETAHYAEQDSEVYAALEQADKGTARLADYVRKNGNTPIYGNTQVKYFPLGEDKFTELLRQLEEAEEFIFMEYFILKDGYMWREILRILEEKAQD